MENKYLYKLVLSTVMFNSEKKILLGKRSMDENVLPGYWGLPGGKAEYRESISDFLEVELKREIMEEVGVNIENIKYLESHLNGPSGKVNICFISYIKEGDIPEALDETEEVGWFSLEEAKELQLTPNTIERIELALKK